MREDQHSWAANLTRRCSRRAITRAAAAGAGIAGLAAVGCAGGRKSGAVKSGSGGAAPAGSAADSGLKPGNFKTGGTLQLRLNNVATLDPYYGGGFVTVQLAGHVYSRLFRFVAGTDPNLFLQHQVAPDLIDSYEVGPDRVTYTVRLRPNATFHAPLGRPLTSADVLASWQRFTTDPRSVNAGAFTPFVDSLTAADGATLVFKLKAPS